MSLRRIRVDLLQSCPRAPDVAARRPDCGGGELLLGRLGDQRLQELNALLKEPRASDHLHPDELCQAPLVLARKWGSSTKRTTQNRRGSPFYIGKRRLGVIDVGSIRSLAPV